MRGDIAIEIVDLKKTYRDGWVKQAVHALRGISFEVRRGEIFGLLGPNGAGKTTVIKVLLGIARKSGGAASLWGHPAGDREGRQRIGYLPENLQVPAHHTANSALDFYGGLSGMSRAEVHRRRADLLEMVELEKRAGEYVRTYSKGMRQRLGLAQALMHDPEMLILDEPTDGLDPVGRRKVRDLLKHLKHEGKTIFLNSHLLQEVEMVCDRVAILDYGQVKYSGDVDEVTQAARGSDRMAFELDLVGEDRAVRDALKQASIANLQEQAETKFHVSLTVADQAEMDRYVDELRVSGVSIVGLVQKRVSLEDAFIKLLGRGDVEDADVIEAE